MSHDVSTTFTARDTYDPPGPDSEFESPFQAYGASKALALKATERFVAEKKPSFDVINIMPSMVIGKNELNATKEAVASGTNNNIMAPLLGINTPSPVLGVSVHVDDVAKAHIDAFRPDIPGNRNFICSSGGLQGTEWNSVKSVAAQLFKKEVSDGSLPSNGFIPTRPIRLDASDTEEVFGWKFKGFDEQVKSVVQHYLELLEAEELRL